MTMMQGTFSLETDLKTAVAYAVLHCCLCSVAQVVVLAAVEEQLPGRERTVRMVVLDFVQFCNSQDRVCADAVR